MLSPNIIESERQVSTILDVLVATGGISNVLLIVGKLLLSMF